MSDDDVEIAFPIEFAVFGTPISLQASVQSRDRWKQRVQEALNRLLPGHLFATDKHLGVTLYDFPTDEPEGDIDNIIKPILDSMNQRVYLDDNQVRRVVAQRFLLADIDRLGELPPLVARALVNDPPFVYIHLTDEPLEQAK